jgi:hypothetical protein
LASSISAALPSISPEKGFKVMVPILDPTQGIEYRGAQLRDQINAAFANGSIDQSQKTHIIAHSMGGLDGRWMLSPAKPESHPSSCPFTDDHFDTAPGLAHRRSN